MKFNARQRLKDALSKLLHSDTEEEFTTPVAQQDGLNPLNLDAQAIEENAKSSADFWQQYPNSPAPWLRAWAQSNPGEVLQSWRATWEARSLGVETPEYQRWQEKFSAMELRYFEQLFEKPENRAKVVLADFPPPVGDGVALHYLDNGIHYRLPNALQSAFPAVSASLPQGASQPRSVSGGAPAPV